MTELVRHFRRQTSSPRHSYTTQQIEQNLTFDFSLTAEDGSALKPVFGPGATGLSNLGNRWGQLAAMG